MPCLRTSPERRSTSNPSKRRVACDRTLVATARQWAGGSIAPAPLALIRTFGSPCRSADWLSGNIPERVQPQFIDDVPEQPQLRRARERRAHMTHTLKIGLAVVLFLVSR